MSDMKAMLSRYNELLPVGTSVSYTEAERRAGEFLYAMSEVTNLKHVFSSEKIKLLTVQTTTYASEMGRGTAKTVTENKLTAEASSEYIMAREGLEEVDNDISYLRAMFDVYQNAHVFYRQLAKGESK
jgi:hypothetical protein